MKASPCPKPNIRILHNDLVLNSGFMSYLLKYWWNLLLSQEKLYFGIPKPRRGCMPASHLSPSSAYCYTQRDTAKCWCTAVRILPYREFTKCLTCAIIHIFHFHHLSIDPTSKNVPMSICGCLAILQPSETNETTKLLLLNLMQDGIF